MKDNKLITVTTRMFTLELYWNFAYVSTQLAILIGLLAVRFFAKDDAVIRMCTVFFILNIIVILFLLLQGASVAISDASESKDVPKESMNVKVESSSDKKVEKKSEKKSSGEIRNKVPVPNPTPKTAEPVESTNKSTATSVPVPSVPVPSVSKPSTDNTKERSSVRSISEMTESDWEELFEMRGDL